MDNITISELIYLGSMKNILYLIVIAIFASQ